MVEEQYFGEPGEPGQPGEPGRHGGGAGGRGGRGGRGGGGISSVPRRIAITKLAALFIAVLAVSLLIFAISNKREHDRVLAADYQSCLKDQQIARNQKRVILTVLALADKEFQEGHPVEIARIKEALGNVPEFVCTK